METLLYAFISTIFPLNWMPFRVKLDTFSNKIDILQTKSNVSNGRVCTDIASPSENNLFQMKI